jgi:hypothetical protein
LILVLNAYCFIFDKTAFITALTVMDGAITAFIGFGSYFKEKNFQKNNIIEETFKKGPIQN